MRVEVLGNGPPEVAVVGGIHGDEPCGVGAVERLLAEPPAVERSVKLIIANEEAVEAGVRYVEEDLNRAFPGDPDGPTHESRLAARLVAELDGLPTLALHSTQSHDEPFAVVHRLDDRARAVCPRLPVAAVVETRDLVEGRLFTAADLVEVECGRQGTVRAAENAVLLVEAFLDAMGALPDAPTNSDQSPAREVPTFRLVRPVPKEPAREYEVYVENFREVPTGSRFAAVDGRPLLAEEAFYPVLLSAEGYDDRFGYVAERTGTL